MISDMEGVAGIVRWQQVGGGEPMYDEGRRLYTEEINAAVRGARAAGVRPARCAPTPSSSAATCRSTPD